MSLTKATDKLSGFQAESNALSSSLSQAKDKAAGLTEEFIRLGQSADKEVETPVFDFAGQAEKAKADIQMFESALQRLNDQLAKEQDPASIKALQYEISTTEQAYAKFRENISKPVSDIMEIQELEKQLEAARTAMTMLELQYVDLQEAGKPDLAMYIQFQKAQKEVEWLENQLATLQSSDVSLSVEGADNIKDIGQSAEQTAEKAERLKSVLGGLITVATSVGSVAVSAIKKVGSVIGSVASGAVKAAKSIGRVAANILTLGKNSRTASNGVGGLFKRIMSLVSAAFVFNVLRQGLNALKKDLGAVLLANQEFANSWNAVKVNLLTAFAPLWQVVEPAIITFMDLLANFTSMLAQFMATLFGKTYEQAKQAAKGIYDQTKAVDSLGKAAKRAIAPFDELIILSSEAASGTSADTSGLDFSAVEAPDFSWIDTFAKKIKELEPDLEYFHDLGFELGNKIADQLEKIPWGTIQKQVEGKVKELAAFLNGLVDNDRFWNALGNTLKKGIETALKAANTFLEEFHWYDFGVRIAELFNNLIELMPEYGRLIGNAIDAALKFANGFIDTFHWYDFGKGLADIFNELIKRLPELGTTIGKLINGVLDTIKGLVKNTNWTELGQNLAIGLQNILDEIPEGKLGETFSEIVNGIFTALFNFFNTFDFIGFGKRIGNELNTAMDKIDWELVSSTLELIIQKILNGATAFLKTFKWQELGNRIGELLNSVFKGIKHGEAGEALAAAVNASLGFIKGAIDKFDFKENGKILALNINKFINDINWDEVGALISDGITGGLVFLNSAIENLDIVAMADSIITFFENVKWGEISSAFWDLVGNALVAGLYLLGRFVDYIVGGILKMLVEPFVSSEIMDYIAKATDEMGGSLILGVLAGIGKAIVGIGKWIWDFVVKPIIDAFKDLFGIHSPSTVMAEIGGYIMDGLLNGIKSMVDSVIEFFNGILTDIQNIFQGIGQWFSGRWTDITNSFSEVGTFFQTAFDTAWTNIKNVFNGAGTWFTNTVWGGIKSAFSNITTWFKDKFSEAWQAVKNVFSSGGQIFDGIKDGILNGLKAVINSLISGINTIIKIPFDGINSVLQSIKGVNIMGFTPFSGLPTISVPQIPRLARGGIVDSATVAMIGEKGRDFPTFYTKKQRKSTKRKNIYEKFTSLGYIRESRTKVLDLQG